MARKVMDASGRPVDADSIAAKFKNIVGEARVSIHRNVVCILQSFEPDDVEAFYAAEALAKRALAILPQTSPGSVWGTDSGSVGGLSGLGGGYMRLSKSGVSRLVLRAIIEQGIGRVE